MEHHISDFDTSANSPPPPPPPDSRPPAEPAEPDLFSSWFPPLLKPERPALPESIKPYLSNFMAREAFDLTFTDLPSIFQPQKLEQSMKLNPFAKEIEKLLISACDRAGHALSPLVKLMELTQSDSACSSEESRQLVALATLAVGQSIAQMTYIRRINALKDIWGPQHLETARRLLKESSFPEDDLFGEQFSDCLLYTSPSPRD